MGFILLKTCLLRTIGDFWETLLWHRTNTHSAPTLGKGKGRKGQYLVGVEGLEAGLGRAVEGAGDNESVV